jgi:hypothetical protein
MTDEGFTHIRDIIPGVMKEIVRRVELRERLEAESGRPLTDDEFLQRVDRNGSERGDL